MALLKDQANGWFGNGHHPEGQGDEQGESPSEGAVQGLVEGREVPLRHQFGQKGIGGHPGRLGHHPHRDEHDPPGIVQPADGPGPRHRAKDPHQLFIQDHHRLAQHEGQGQEKEPLESRMGKIPPQFQALTAGGGQAGQQEIAQEGSGQDPPAESLHAPPLQNNSPQNDHTVVDQGYQGRHQKLLA